MDLPGFDRVMVTASDRPEEDSLPAMIDPAANHLNPEVARRRADVDEKHLRVIEFLDTFDYEAVVLTRADSIAWFTAGGDVTSGSRLGVGFGCPVHQPDDASCLDR